jgi:signal transduction histidine kinase/DNA-binding response OmpR family regulator
MADPLRILILEDSATDAELVQFELEQAGLVFTPKVVAVREDYIQALQSFSPGLILSDYDLPGYNGALALAEAAGTCPDAPFILVSGVVSEDRAVDILTQGAKDYVLKSRLQQRLVPAVRRALAEAQEYRARREAEAALREAYRTLEERVKSRTAELQAEVAARRKTEEELRESRATLEAALASMTDAVFISDARGHFIDFNDAFVTFHRFRSKDECSKVLAEYPTIVDVFMDDGTPAPPDMWAVPRALRGETVSNAEYTLRRKDTGETWVGSYSFAPIRNRDGQIVGSVVAGRDITERKRAEQDRERLQAQLLQSQKMESIGRLAGGVAHDFNNMLGVILGHVEMALEQVDPNQPLSADLQAIRRAAERSADLTGQLLAFARKQTISPRVLDINEAVTGTLKMLRRLIGEDIHLVWLPGRDLWPVKVDPSQIDQILANLCVNARDAIAGVGKVTIETGNVSFNEAYCADHPGFPPGDHVFFALSDNGCGMDKETIGKLFEPFFTTKELGKGTGLGLATVYGIVKQNDGFINVYSEPGQGTTFRIYLPRHTGKAEQTHPDSQPDPVMRGQETILVVEDEEEILSLSKRMLEKQGYRVLTAMTPGEAIRQAEQYPGVIHLLVTDVVMPEMNGRELAKKMLSLYPNLKRLFMSGYTANVIAHHGVLDEGVQFIQKPFSTRDLANKVRETLDQP